jgi:hypothetical protein
MQRTVTGTDGLELLREDVQAPLVQSSPAPDTDVESKTRNIPELGIACSIPLTEYFPFSWADPESRFAQVFPGFQGFRPLVLTPNATLDANLIRSI